MMRAICCEGDATSHGGTVIKASGHFLINNRRNVCLGDLVSCPIHGINPITGPGSTLLDHGIAVVLDGCQSQCGSTIIASGYLPVTVNTKG